MRFHLFLAGFLFSTQAGALVCDTEKALTGLKLSDTKTAVSRKYQKSYDDLFKDFKNSIKAMTEQAKLPENRAWEIYAGSRTGKRTIEELKNKQSTFGYDAISAYLFDSSANKPPIHYTNIYSKDSKVYYIDGNRVVAVLKKTDSDEGQIQVLDKDCSIKNIGDFSTFAPKSLESFLNFKVNKGFCSNFRSKKIQDIDEDAQEKAGVYFNVPDEEKERNELRKKMNEACQAWETQAATNPAPSQTGQGAK